MDERPSPHGIWGIAALIGALAAVAFVMIPFSPPAFVDAGLVVALLIAARVSVGPLRRALITASLLAAVIVNLSLPMAAGEHGLGQAVYLFGGAALAVAAFLGVLVIGWAAQRALMPDVVERGRIAVGRGAGATSAPALRVDIDVTRGRVGRYAARGILVAVVAVVLAQCERGSWRGAAADPRTSALRMSLIWRYSDYVNKGALLQNPAFDVDRVVATAMTESSSFLVQMACRNTHLDDATLRRVFAVRSDEPSVYLGIASNKNASAELLEQVFRAGPLNDQIARAFGEHPHTPPFVLVELWPYALTWSQADWKAYLARPDLDQGAARAKMAQADREAFSP